MDKDKIFKIAPCLESGPLSDAGLNFVETALEIPKSVTGDILKSWAVYYLFLAKESAFKKKEDPTSEILTAFAMQSSFLGSFKELDLDYFYTSEVDTKNRNSIDEIEQETGNHYGHLFKNFDPDSYFGEAVKLLKTRLEVNNIFPADLSKKSVLDVGCGGGRYSAAWKKLGAANVQGVDFSEIGINNARERIKNTHLDIQYEIEDVLNLSFSENSFDIVFSNGVLHHSRDLNKGVAELIRVLKTGGLGWLYLIESPGGYFWDIIEILRVVMNDVSNKIARESLKILRVPPNRIFYILDHIMAPINIRLTGDEIVSILKKNGAKKIKRLERGCDFDRVEKIYRKEPFAQLMFGVGEHRYVFSK